MPSIEQLNDVLDGRPGFCIRGKWGYLSALLGGGHLCEFVLNGRPNPLWAPHWKTIDPDQYSGQDHENAYGSPTDGRLLAAIAGHSLSFDQFGPASPEEAAAGLTTHGEAPSACWRITKISHAQRPSVTYGAELPTAQIDFRRQLTIEQDHPVFYCEETAFNRSAGDRPICWNQHVTIGPPFLACDRTLVDMPATRAKVAQAGFSDTMMVVPDALFEWPLVPTGHGGMHDLRTTPDGHYSRYTAQLLDPRLSIGYVAVANPSANLLLLYAFRRSDYPWVGNWEERFCRRALPWAGKTFCRGLEFSSTPFPIPKRETISRGPLFDEDTYRWLPAKSEVTVRFLALLLEIPSDFEGVEHLSVGDGSFQIHEHGKRRVFSQTIDTGFLAKDTLPI